MEGSNPSFYVRVRPELVRVVRIDGCLLEEFYTAADE